MTGEHLDSLALGYINQERSHTPENVLRVWDRLGHRRVSRIANGTKCVLTCTILFTPEVVLPV